MHAMLSSTCSVHPPQLAAYGAGVACLVVGNLFIVVTGAATYFLVKRNLRHAVWLIVAVMLVLPDLVLPHVQGLVPTHLLSFCRFIFGSVIYLGAMHLVEAIADEAPGKSFSSLGNWLEYLTSVEVKRGKDGHVFPSPPGAALALFKLLMYKMLLLGAAWSSFAAGGGRWRPLAEAAPSVVGTSWAAGYAAMLLDDLIGSIVVWLFLAIILDVGGLLLIVQGKGQPIVAFDNPIFASTSPVDTWGRRWNMQMHAVFKRACFLPLVKSGVPKLFAGFATFLLSAVYHELQFSFSFSSYTLGPSRAHELAHAARSAAQPPSQPPVRTHRCTTRATHARRPRLFLLRGPGCHLCGLDHSRALASALAHRGHSAAAQGVPHHRADASDRESVCRHLARVRHGRRRHRYTRHL